MNLVVPNSTPLIASTSIGRFSGLRELFVQIHIPEAVVSEVAGDEKKHAGSWEILATCWINRVHGYKKKEFIGNLYRYGSLYTLEYQDVFDHDFPHLADGIIIPHGIYDVIKNEAYVNIGTSVSAKRTTSFPRQRGVS